MLNLSRLPAFPVVISLSRTGNRDSSISITDKVGIILSTPITIIMLDKVGLDWGFLITWFVIYVKAGNTISAIVSLFYDYHQRYLFDLFCDDDSMRGFTCY